MANHIRVTDLGQKGVLISGRLEFNCKCLEPLLICSHSFDFDIIIMQRSIPISEQHQMAAEFHSLPEVCDALRAAEISIGLLSSTGAEPNVFYKKYLEDVLRMPASQFLVSGKVCYF